MYQRTPFKFDAVIFDLDGVITDTARVHAAAWKSLFDEYLRSRADKSKEEFRPFSLDGDYRYYVDGKPRYDGVRSFLHSRGIELPFGDPSDGPQQETICGLGNRKDRVFVSIVKKDGVRVFESSVRLIKQLRDQGVRCGLISSSKNCQLLLQLSGTEDLFEAKVDGVMSAALKLRGKPAPDIFLKCAQLLKVSVGRSVVVEDAIAGVQAGRNGGFGLVIGVDRAGLAEKLKENGADVVVRDLSNASPPDIDQWFRTKLKQTETN